MFQPLVLAAPQCRRGRTPSAWRYRTKQGWPWTLFLHCPWKGETSRSWDEMKVAGEFERAQKQLGWEGKGTEGTTLYVLVGLVGLLGGLVARPEVVAWAACPEGKRTRGEQTNKQRQTKQADEQNRSERRGRGARVKNVYEQPTTPDLITQNTRTCCGKTPKQNKSVSACSPSRSADHTALPRPHPLHHLGCE